MSLFEFQMVLLSILVGLGLAELLGGFARLLRRGRLCELSLAHASVLLTLLLALVQLFWESWTLRDVEAWTYPGLLLMLTPPALVYLMAHLALPEDEAGTLGEYYHARSRVLYGLAVVAVTAGVLFRPLAFGAPLLELDNLQSFVSIALLSVLAWSRSPSVHRVLAPLMLVGIVLDTGVITYRLA